jgi:hypothetical protein
MTATTACLLDTRERSGCGLTRRGAFRYRDGRIAMELYCAIGAGDQGGMQSYVDALARAKHLQERPMLSIV